MQIWWKILTPRKHFVVVVPLVEETFKLSILPVKIQRASFWKFTEKTWLKLATCTTDTGQNITRGMIQWIKFICQVYSTETNPKPGVKNVFTHLPWHIQSFECLFLLFAFIFCNGALLQKSLTLCGLDIRQKSIHLLRQVGACHFDLWKDITLSQGTFESTAFSLRN